MGPLRSLGHLFASFIAFKVPFEGIQLQCRGFYSISSFYLLAQKPAPLSMHANLAEHGQRRAAIMPAQSSLAPVPSESAA